jgi:leucyl aminopeptidase
VGLVENMTDGNAMRPGDVITSMSGKTVEVLNTDAEGRLVLADIITYARKYFDPALMIDLATLTGAVIVALGQHNAGLFSNDDELSKKLIKAGIDTSETLWRMPLSDDYDKMINSKVADMKNIGGRDAGSVTAAQFIKRYVGDVPWAHIDIAGTSIESLKSDINTSWGSGYGVRLLDNFIKQNFED